MLKLFKRVIRKIYIVSVNAYDIIFGQRDKLVPPKVLSDVGTSDFEKTGEEFLNYFVELCNLKPNERVLDIGCGIGRMAIPLTKYLDENGSYEGFDIVKDEINWCKKNISARYPNFQFQLADVYNKRYNFKGKYKASDYIFPYKDESFDFVYLTSVFTHMLPGDIENYFCEIARVLKKNGRCLITSLLLNEDSLQFIRNGKSSLDLKYDFKNYRTTDAENPEAVIGITEIFFINLYIKYNLKIIKPIFYGSWCGRSNFKSYQDIIIAVKE